VDDIVATLGTTMTTRDIVDSITSILEAEHKKDQATWEEKHKSACDILNKQREEAEALAEALRIRLDEVLEYQRIAECEQKVCSASTRQGLESWRNRAEKAEAECIKLHKEKEAYTAHENKAIKANAAYAQCRSETIAYSNLATTYEAELKELRRRVEKTEAQLNELLSGKIALDTSHD
jgi:hypothetical protein